MILINKKNTRLLKNSFFAFLIKGISILVSFVLMPIYLKYFSNTYLLGTWFSITSILNWLLFFDFGIGSSLRNYLTEAIGKSKRNKILGLLTSAYSLSLAITIIIGSLMFFWAIEINWNQLLNIPNYVILNKDLISAIRILILSMSLQLVLRIINSVFYSLQKSVIPDLLFTISNVIFLFLLIFFGGSENNGIVKMAWFHLISFSTPLLVATFYLYTFKLKWLCPGIKYLNKNSTFSLMKSGGLFFVIQLLALVISNTNELFISYFIGAKDVVEYKLYYSILGMPVSIIAILGNPLWSEISQARVHQNILWIRKILVRLLQLLGIFFILMLIVVLISQYLFDCWLGEGTIEVNNFYLIVMSIYCFFLLWNTFVSVIVMGIGVLKFPLVLLLVCSVADIYLTIEISKFISNWSSVVLANIVSLFIYCVFLSIWLFRYLGRRNENSSEIV